MGTFAETVIVDCHLCFADQEKQTSVFCFLFPYIYTHICTDNVTIYMYVYMCIYIHIYIHIYIYAAFSNGKRKPRRFSLIRIPLAQHANGSLPFVVDEKTNGSYQSCKRFAVCFHVFNQFLKNRTNPRLPETNKNKNRKEIIFPHQIVSYIKNKIRILHEKENIF
jgi:hypothetical protein